MKVYAASRMESLLELDASETERFRSLLRSIEKAESSPEQVGTIESTFAELVAPFLSSCGLQIDSKSVCLNIEEKIFKVQCQGFLLEAPGMPYLDGSVPLRYASGYECTYFPTILFDPREEFKVLSSGGYAQRTPTAQVARDIAVVLYPEMKSEYQPFRTGTKWTDEGGKVKTTTVGPGPGKVGIDVVPVTYLSEKLKTLQDAIRGLRADRLDILVQLRTELDSKSKEHRPYTRFIEKSYWDFLREKLR